MNHEQDFESTLITASEICRKIEIISYCPDEISRSQLQDLVIESYDLLTYGCLTYNRFIELIERAWDQDQPRSLDRFLKDSSTPLSDHDYSYKELLNLARSENLELENYLNHLREITQKIMTEEPNYELLWGVINYGIFAMLQGASSEQIEQAISIRSSF